MINEKNYMWIINGTNIYMKEIIIGSKYEI